MDADGGWLHAQLERPACCFCDVWVPGGQGVAAAMFGPTGLSMLICRNECVTFAHIYARTGILTHVRSTLSALARILFRRSGRKVPAGSV